MDSGLSAAAGSRPAISEITTVKNTMPIDRKHIDDERAGGLAGAEVRGEVLLAILEGMPSLEIEVLQILGRHGISQPEAGGWYPLERLISAWEEIGQRMTPTALYAMGSKLADRTGIHLDIKDFADFTRNLDVIYHGHHRGGAFGQFAAEWEDERRVRIFMASPYPCDFERGILYGFARRWPPPGATRVSVEHDDQAPCRKRGARSCSYRLTW